MGIRLDWEVESEKSIQQSVGEDPEARRRRRIALFRLLFTLALIVGIVGGVAAFVVDQINRVNQRLEMNLRDTVQAEITALRIGDWNAFATFQRSADEEWLRLQRTQFERYQEILLESENTQLTGQILEVYIDDPRARVHVQEIIDGVPYTRVWFYWLYDAPADNDMDSRPGGWYHVPPDYTFWGSSQRYEGEFVNVAYRDVDSELAGTIGTVLDGWIMQGCDVFDCVNLPPIRVQVSPQDARQIAWAAGALDEEWLLLLPSPYADRARTDMPFSPEMRVQVATLLAERMTAFQANGQRTISTDATYLQQAVITWLIGQFVQVNTGAHLIDSLAQNYGQQAIGTMIRRLPPGADIGYLSDVTLLPLDQSDLDWRDFFTWRLREEQALWERNLRSEFMLLYDIRDDVILQGAEQRFREGVNTEDMVVLSVGVTSPTDAGQPQLLATVMRGSGETFQVVFRLVNNKWLRAS